MTVDGDLGARGWVGVALVVAGIVGGLAWWATSFETTRSITASANRGLGESEPVVVDVRLSCSFDGTAQYLDEGGEQLWFNAASRWWTDESSPAPADECVAARDERRPTGGAIALAGVLAGVLLLSSDLARANRAAASQLDDRAARAASTGAGRPADEHGP